MLRRLVPFVLIALAACAAHEKAGDRAAAVGDWKTAEAHYAEAVRKDPAKKELQDKYRQARGAALDDATRKARACAGAADWECALGEADYALRLDAGNAELAALRRDAGRGAGYLRLRRAEDAAARRDLAAALGLVEGAREATDDAGVATEARRVAPPIVRAAVDEAERFRRAAQFPQAIDLLARAARVDPGVGPRLEAARAEHERWKDMEAERLAGQGDALLAERRYADAQVSYEAALKVRPQGRAAPLARYAALLAAGDAAVGRRDFAAAERAFGEASALGVDHERGLAVAELDRVRVRPYAIRLRSVLVRPTRPDGYPWSGSRGRDLERVVNRLGDLARGAAPTPVGMVLDLARRVPPQNQPTLVLAIALPDGRAVQTAPRRGVYARLDGSFVITANAYDDRAISIRVVHDEGSGRPMDVGMVSFRIADLVASGELGLADASVTELRVEADPDDLPEGTVAGLAPIPDAANLAAAWSMPTAASQGYRLVSLDATAGSADLKRTPADGGPDLYVEIEQRGTVVYQSPVMAGRSTASLRPPAVYLFVAPDEAITVRVWDRRRGGTDLVVEGKVTGRALERGGLDVTTPRGSALRMRVEPRRVGPGVQVAAR
jgi:tetratricopeptide (TPR) repeat protein